MKISHIVTGSGTINAVIGNKSYVVPKDHTNYKEIVQALNKDDDKKFVELSDVAKTLTTFTSSAGNVEIKDGVLYWAGQPMHNALSDRILQLKRDGHKFEPMLKFMANLMENPSKRAVDELYTFLEHKGLPITVDGHFLAYKRVRENFKDHHSGTIDFSVGKVVEVPRNTVDDNWRTACSSGIHAGSQEYVSQFHPGSPVIIVKINPKDVVSVPSSEVTKLRTCKLEVVQLYDTELTKKMDDTLHSSVGLPVDPNDDWDDEDDYKDDDYLDDDEEDDDYDSDLDDSWLEEDDEDLDDFDSDLEPLVEPSDDLDTSVQSGFAQ